MIHHQIASAFYEHANRFCSFLETLGELNQNSCRQLAIGLSEIFGLALQLPDIEPNSELASKKELKRLSVKFGKYDSYWEIYDPFNLEEAVCGSLYDDISDIYKELYIGITLYPQDINEAIWHWKWSFENHWSYHAVDSLRVLNQILQNQGELL